MGHPSAVSHPPPTPTRRTWRAAWQEALYGPSGFYRTQAPAAHFATSAQGVPGAGAVLAEAVAAMARDTGCTAVVDLGCGRGELLTHLRTLDPALHLTGVDVVDRPEGLDVDAWLVSPGGAGLPAGLRGLTRTLVLAHEWLDVVPCPVVERDDHEVWREVEVVEAEGGGWGERLGDPLAGAELAWARRWLPGPVSSAEIGLPRDRAFADLVSRVRSGLVLAVDYGHTLTTRPPHGTLTGFRSGREVEPAPDGSCDLTAHVAVDSLVATLEGPTGRLSRRLSRQRERLGELLDEPTGSPPHDLARGDPTAYLESMRRRGALATLTAPGGLGDFWWVEVVVGHGSGAPGPAAPKVDG